MNEPIPYIVYEGTMVRFERTIKRLWILCIIMFTALVISNGMWVYYESQFTTVETVETVEQDVNTGDGTAMVTGKGRQRHERKKPVKSLLSPRSSATSAAVVDISPTGITGNNGVHEQPN